MSKAHDVRPPTDHLRGVSAHLAGDRPVVRTSHSTSKPIVRTRFAPSPTGELHLGGARTALYEYLFAKHEGGEVLLRIEDTDQKRYVSRSMDRFMDDLEWLGITFDGEPIIQSSRVARHHEVAHQLVANGAAYYEPSTDDRHGQKRADEEYRAGRTVYRGVNREITEQPSGPYVIRLKVPDGTIVLDDLVRGRVEFDLATIDDAVLLKSDGMPTYHLAAMVDDHDLEISHVIRSEEWLPSTPKHLLIFQALGWEAPRFAHLPVILASDGKKLSKRVHGESVWIGTYRKAGYLPEALTNYLTLLGWNPGGDREFMTRDELIAAFSLDRVHKAGAKFDEAKLDAFQQHYVKSLTDDELLTKLKSYLREKSSVSANLGSSSANWRSRQTFEVFPEQQFARLVHVLHDRLGRFDEFPALASWVAAIAEYPTERLIFRKSTSDSTIRGLAAASRRLESADESRWASIESLSQLLASIVADEGLTNGDVFWPVRVALTGLDQSPSPGECLWVLGRTESLQRLSRANSRLQAPNDKRIPKS